MFIVLLLSPLTSNATLITSVTATGGSVVDTVNGQEWLRLDVTTGLTIAEALTLSAVDGFAWATEGELNDLLDQFFGIYGGDNATRAGDYAFGTFTTAGAEAQWNSLFGLTYSQFNRESLGFYDDETGGSEQSWYGFNSSPATFNATLAAPVFDIAVFLVRDVNSVSVPEPSTIVLFGSLLGFMCLVRRRRKG